MCAPTTSQYAAIEALKNGDDDVKKMRDSYDQRRRFLLDAFKKMGLECFEPFGAFYVFPCIKEFGMTSEEFAIIVSKDSSWDTARSLQSSSCTIFQNGLPLNFSVLQISSIDSNRMYLYLGE